MELRPNQFLLRGGSMRRWLGIFVLVIFLIYIFIWKLENFLFPQSWISTVNQILATIGPVLFFGSIAFVYYLAFMKMTIFEINDQFITFTKGKSLKISKGEVQSIVIKKEQVSLGLHVPSPRVSGGYSLNLKTAQCLYSYLLSRQEDRFTIKEELEKNRYKIAME